MTFDALFEQIQKILSSNVFTLALQGLIVYLAILWIAIIIWVTKDANNRSNSLLFQVFSILIVIFLTPLFGLLIYLILRPSKTLTERYIEEMQMQLLAEAEEEERKKLQMISNNREALVDEDEVEIEVMSPKEKLKKALSRKKDEELKENE